MTLSLSVVAEADRGNVVRERRRLVVAAIAATTIAGVMFALPQGAGAVSTTFTVTTNADGGPGSLRDAITQANANAGTDTITFAGPMTITPASLLPVITDPVVIDGTVGGSCASGFGDVHLDGDGGSLGVQYQDRVGLNITAGSSVVRGLAVDGFNIAGIRLRTGDGNTVECNRVGLTSPFGQQATGVEIISSGNNVVGGAGAANRNVLSGNGTGVSTLFAASHDNLIEGNYIGTDLTGTVAIPNWNAGVSVSTASVDTSVLHNVISGNYYGLTTGNADGVVLQGNLIGTDVSGTVGLGNQVKAVEINQTSGAVIGGPNPGDGNVVSGTGGQFAGEGLTVDNSPGTVVQGNLIGTDITGTVSIPNTAEGLAVRNTTGAQIGGLDPGEGNVIAGSGYYGISVSGCVPAPNCTPGGSVVVEGNHVGTDLTNTHDLGNGWEGIQIYNASDVTVRGNVVTYNQYGVRVLGSLAGTHVTENAIDGNDGLGIDLDLDGGVTPNDVGDPDDGPNGLQNWPELTDAETDGVTTTIEGALHSTASSDFDVEVFVGPACDGSGHGEGRRFLGVDTATTDASGDATIQVTTAVVEPGDYVTATATGPDGSTSEFSNCVAVTGTAPTPFAISAVTPASTAACTGACPDLPVTITGTGFQGSTTIVANGVTPIDSTDVDATTIDAVLPGSLLESPSVIQLTAVDGTLVTAPKPFFVNASSAAVTESGSASNDDPFGAATASTSDLQATGNGAGTLSVSQYDGNPVAVEPPTGTTSYFDINGAPGSSFSLMTVTVCNLDPSNTSHTVYWFNEQTSPGSWEPVSPQTYDEDSHCVTMTFNDFTSSPRIVYLTGTPLALGPAAPADTDGDGIDDSTDNCPATPNSGQANVDGDALGDLCDPDIDGDGVANGVDNCPRVANALQGDRDHDTVGNACDPDFVAYGWTGFLSPIMNPTALNTGKVGSTFALKWKLTSPPAEVRSLSVVQRIAYKSVACNAFNSVPTGTLLTLSSGGTAPRYDPKAHQYLYNWQAPKVAGCYVFFLMLDDDSVHTAYFKLK